MFMPLLSVNKTSGLFIYSFILSLFRLRIMLIHGRLVVTQHGLMLDEVRSLLQKCLRRQEIDLAYRATKELISHEKDQLPWKSIVTFMFEDHCLTDVTTLTVFYDTYRQKNKFKAIEILGKCLTCRHSACLQRSLSATLTNPTLLSGIQIFPWIPI